MANNVHLRSSANGFDFHSQAVLQRRKRHQFVEQRFERFFVAFEHHCFFETLKHRNLPEPVHSRFQTVIPTSTSITVSRIPRADAASPDNSEEKTEDLRFCRWVGSARTQRPSLASCLMLDRICCEVCVMLRVLDCHHCFAPPCLHCHSSEREDRMEVSQLALQLWDYVHFVCTITTSIIIGNNSVASKEHSSRSLPSVSWPNPAVKDLLSTASSHEDSNLVIPVCDLAVFLVCVLEGFCCLLSPSSGRPAILATILGTSARCCSAVWAVVLASVVCACH